MPDSPSRYQNSALIGQGATLYLGRRVLPSLLPRSDDQFVTVRIGDNLHLMAFRTFGDQRLWWVIADFNDILDPMAELTPGTLLRVPSTARLWMDVLR